MHIIFNPKDCKKINIMFINRKSYFWIGGTLDI